MKLSRSVARSRARQRSKIAAEASVRRAKWDRRAVGVVIGIILSLVVAFWFVVTVPSPLGWITQVLLLCLVVAAGAARALLGFGGRAQDAKLSTRWSRMATGWPVVLAASVIVYVHSLSVGFLSDDFGLFYGARQAANARHALSTQALPSFFRPLSILLWWSGTKLWAGVPIGYHVANVLLHSVNSLLVYAVANRIIASRYGAAMAGLLFALHPLHVEPVVWLSCSADLLCTTFCLLSLLSLEVSLTATSPTRRILAAGGGLLAFWLALLSKEAALALPGVVVLRLALLGRERRWRRLLTLGPPYAAVLGGYLAWRFLVMGSFGGYQVRLNLWNTVFPSAPLRHLAGFFFPETLG